MFGWFGKILFLPVLVLFSIPFFWRHSQHAPQLLMTIGILYTARSVFLLLLPIGPPMGAIPPSDRINLWGFANHAFFPGGHVGLLFTLTMLLNHRRWRRIGYVIAAIFALGTMLSKTHYTADAVGGLLLAYAVVTWSRRHLSGWVLDGSTETKPS